MIDKLDLRIPRRTPFTSEFERIYSELRAMDRGPFRAAKYYEYAGDLREYGFHSRLSQYCVMDKVGNHKLELIDVGEMTKANILNEITQIFDIEPRQLEIMRIDFAVDVPDLSVQWFRETVRVAHKRWRAAVTGDAFYSEMGNGNIQTLYFGKRPNLTRIYDKQAEYRHAYKTLVRNLGKGVEPPTFESLYGSVANGRILTRVERQIGGRVPAQIATLADVFDHGAEFKPFAGIKIFEHVALPPKESDTSFETYCTGMYLRRMAEEDGMQALGSFISRNSKGNPAWAWGKYRPFLPSASPSLSLTNAALQTTFEQSLHRQLAA